MQDYKKAYQELLIKNTQLSSQVNFYRLEHERFKDQTLTKMREVIRHYDEANEKAAKFLIDKDILQTKSAEFEEFCRIFPVKIGGKK